MFALSPIFALFIVLSGCAIPRWPVDGRMTSPYGVRMAGLWPRLHHGVDVAVPEGTPVRAMAPGIVTYAGWWGSYGITVVIDHGGQTTTLYAHLSSVTVEPGTRVGGRDVIGLSGNTGNSTGPHLHFEIRRRGYPEDPVYLLGRMPSTE